MRVINVFAVVFLLVTGLFVPCSGLTAQDSELDLPDTRLLVGIGELDDDGKMVLGFTSKGAMSVPVTETVRQNYTVSVPYIEKVMRDGKEVEETKYRTETRTREVPVTRMVPQSSSVLELDKLKFYSISGAVISEIDARDHFQSRQPILAVRNREAINDFVKQVFKEDVMVIELPESFGSGMVTPGRRIPMAMPRARAARRLETKRAKDTPQTEEKQKDDG